MDLYEIGLYLIFWNVTRWHWIRFKFEIRRDQMVGDEDIKWPDFSKKSHFINRHDHRIHHFILERFQHHRPILYSEFDCPGLGAILHDPATDSFMSEDGNDVTVSTGAVAFYLSQKGFLEEGGKAWTQMFRW